VPDIWNEVLYAHLLSMGYDTRMKHRWSIFGVRCIYRMVQLVFLVCKDSTETGSFLQIIIWFYGFQDSTMHH
jgi:hypothetical protein